MWTWGNHVLEQAGEGLASLSDKTDMTAARPEREGKSCEFVGQTDRSQDRCALYAHCPSERLSEGRGHSPFLRGAAGKRGLPWLWVWVSNQRPASSAVRRRQSHILRLTGSTKGLTQDSDVPSPRLEGTVEGELVPRGGGQKA